jgi:hypothetical protein
MPRWLVIVRFWLYWDLDGRLGCSSARFMVESRVLEVGLALLGGLTSPFI